MKLAVKVPKCRRTDNGESDWEFLRITKKMFLKEVKRVMKGEHTRHEMVKDVNDQVLHDGVDMRIRWAEYFEQVLRCLGGKYQCIWQLSDVGLEKL